MSITKIKQTDAPRGDQGQRFLASGKSVALRMWENEAPGEIQPKSTRDYEVVGFVLSGRAELHLDNEVVKLEKGDSWLVPARATHAYKILESFTAVEATSPPCH
ncbi:MAG: cupin domain-containing protein [Candidatus Eremiobacteraeota bacterium]|nr:cupin domain-containing protein [Candidatus Eremiobacteraeota bacterium]